MFVATFFLGKGDCGLISSVFHIICSLIYIYGWQAMARRSPEVLPKYFLASSALRLMAAAMVLLVFCVVNRGDIDSIKWFAVVFIIYYLVILAFDALFFAKISNKQKVFK
jgi:cytochrome c biogenesis factor